MLFSKGMIQLSGPRLRKLMKLRHTGRRIIAASTCSTSAAARAIEYVTPRLRFALVRLSLVWY